MRRVVITGMGIVSPLGIGVDHVWQQIIAGQSGIDKIDRFDTSDHPTKIGGQVPTGKTEDGCFDINHWIDPKEQKKMDLFIAYGIVAADMAIADSGWVAHDDDAKNRTGVMIGAAMGGVRALEDGIMTSFNKGPKRLRPFFVPSLLINLASGHVSMRHGFKGPNHAPVTACATGTHAIGDASRMIMFGDADVMVAGGTESAIHYVGVAGFNAARALSTAYNDDPKKASRPWDKGRDGFVMGEGAGVLVLEEYEHAKARGAKIYAEIAGYGMSGDAYHLTSPEPSGDGGYRAMQTALKYAELAPNDIDYINAHGTSTPAGDMVELHAIERLLGNHTPNVAISSTKSSVGHLLGAAGAVEALFCAKTIETGTIPPTLNLDNPEDGTEGKNLVPHVSQQKEVSVALSNSFGFGGTNASLVFKRI